jgi:diphthine synthase
MIGLGLCDEKDITIRGLEIVKKAHKVYLEIYTSMLQCSQEKLEEFYCRKVILADRETIETKSEKIVIEAKEKDIAILIVGDPMGATTHTQLILDAKKQGVNYKVIHNASILTAIGETGLELYKFGKTTSIVFPKDNWNVETYYDVIKKNKKNELHTLCLLDLNHDDKTKKLKCMTVNEAIEQLLLIEKKRKESVFTTETICIGCARIGCDDQKILSGTAKELLKHDFGRPLHCLIIPAKMHFVEEEATNIWREKTNKKR